MHLHCVTVITALVWFSFNVWMFGFDVLTWRRTFAFALCDSDHWFGGDMQARPLDIGVPSCH